MTILLQAETTTETTYGETPKEKYLNLLQRWKADQKQGPNAYDHARFIIERALARKVPSTIEQLTEELKAAFGPVVNTTELANGRKPYDTLWYILANIKLDKSFAYADVAATIAPQFSPYGW